MTPATWVLVFLIHTGGKAAIDHIPGFATQKACEEAGHALVDKPMGLTYHEGEDYRCITTGEPPRP